MVNLTDTHCHLNYHSFNHDLEAVLEHAWERGLSRILVPGTDLESSRQAVQMAAKYPQLYAAVGVHPNDATSWDNQTLEQLRKLAQQPKVVAIGEIGLDYYRQHAPHPLQREIFKTQLELAAHLNLPVILHNRQSGEDLWPMIFEWQAQLVQSGSLLANRPGVLHSFDGDEQIAAQAIQHHFLLGVSGPVTFESAHERHRVTSALPLESVLIETDAPFLTPHPHRGRRNEPAYVSYVAEKIAALHQKPLAFVAKITTQNAQRLFAWGE
jgi:TatD DNase family protein